MSGLQFQSFTNADFNTADTGCIGDNNKTNEDNVSTTGPKRNFFSFGYYQQFFDVDTDQVTKRILNSAVPTHNNFIADFVQPIPDLYGPFWVCVTLVFSIGIFSNIAQYIENEGGSGEYGSDFRMVTGASSLISSYVLLVPSLLYALIWHRKSEVQYSYFEIICAYGYSLSIFIPVSILWTFNINWFRWVLIFAAVTMSGTVLAKALWPAFKNDANKLLSFGVVFGVMFLHFLLAICFKEYFFDAVHARSPTVTKAEVESTATQAKRELPASVLNSTVENAKLPKAGSQTKIDLPKIVTSVNATQASAPTVDGKQDDHKQNESEIKKNVVGVSTETVLKTKADVKEGKSMEAVVEKKDEKKVEVAVSNSSSPSTSQTA